MTMKIDIDNLLKQAQDMQSKMQSAQEALGNVIVTGEAGGGLLKIDIDGKHTVRSIWLNPTLLQESKEFIEELLVSAFNNALAKVEKASRQKLSDITAQIQATLTDNITEA